MATEILIVDGHPDPAPERLCRQLSTAYADGARAAGHAVVRLDLSTADLPLLRTAEDYEHGTPPPFAADAQAAIERAAHVVLVFPLWLGTAPALVKAFLEQTLRPGFARERPKGRDLLGAKRLTGKSVRIVCTMGMPALAYRFYFMGHGLRNLSDNVLRFSGMGPVRWTLVGGVGTVDAARAAREMDRMRSLGRAAR